YLPDPTTTLGDLIVRTAGLQVTRLGVPIPPADGYVLTVDSTELLGINWKALPAAPNATQINLSPAISSWTTVQQAIDGLNTNVTDLSTASVAWTRITGAPTFVDTAGSYTDPTWITINWSKLNGNPTNPQIAMMQTPWLQNINGATFHLMNVSQIGVGATSV